MRAWPCEPRSGDICPNPRSPFCAALPYGDDNNDLYTNDDYEDDGQSRADNVIHAIPRFAGEGETLLVNEGSVVRLPCVVDRLGERQEEALLITLFFSPPSLNNGMANQVNRRLFSPLKRDEFLWQQSAAIPLTEEAGEKGTK